MLDAAGHRHRGRLASQMRPLLSERAVLERADGSAKWVQDGSAVLAAVHGPSMAGQRKEDAEKAVIEVLFKPRNGLAGSREHEYEEMLRQMLEAVVLLPLHPRTLILVVVQVLQADGSLLAVSLNAVCAALVDAGIPMRAMFASVCVGFSADSSSLVIDPDAAEEDGAAALVSAAFPFSHDAAQPGSDSAASRPLRVPAEALLVHSRGRLDAAQLARALDTAHQGCTGVARFVSLSLLHSHRDALVKSGDPAAGV